MKKIFILTILTFILFSCNNSVYNMREKMAKKYHNKSTRIAHRKKNRHIPHPPTNAMVDSIDSHLKVAHSLKPINATNVSPWINSYTISNGLPFPQYFIMRSNELVSFLTGPKPSGYLHIYLSINTNTGSMDLAIAGADSNTAVASPHHYVDVNPFQGQVFGNFRTSSTCGITPDIYMEGNYPYQPYPVIQPLPNIPALIPTGIASISINNYEQFYNRFSVAYSFLIDNSFLAPFLTDSMKQFNYLHGWHSANYPVQYIQIYLAYENTDPNSATVVIVGLDKDGNHVYYTPDGTSLFVFNTAVPCPYCDVDPSLLSPVIQQ